MPDGKFFREFILLLAILIAVLVLGCYRLSFFGVGDKVEGVPETSSLLTSGIVRCRVPTGWIVKWNDRGVCFVPDPDHKWEIK